MIVNGLKITDNGSCYCNKGYSDKINRGKQKVKLNDYPKQRISVSNQGRGHWQAFHWQGIIVDSDTLIVWIFVYTLHNKT